jgi:macrolide transport system ATP-binding/permease protein
MWWRRKPEDFQAELDAHLALEADELRAEGASDADVAARRALGNRTSVEERFFESGRWMFGQHLLRDLRFATRVLRKEPKFSVLTILGLALGIAVSTALFTFASSVQDRGTGIRVQDQVRDPATYISIDRSEATFLADYSYSEYRSFQDHLTPGMERRVRSIVTVDQITADSEPYGLVLSGPVLSNTALGTPSSEAEQVLVRFESANFLAVRGFHAELGRAFSEEEERIGAPVALLSRQLWQQRFGEDPGVLGQTILLNNHPATVIGVADARFHAADSHAVFLPLGMRTALINDGDWLHDPQKHWLMINARLRPGIALPQAQAAIQSLGRSFDETDPASDPNLKRNIAYQGVLAPRMRRERDEIILGVDLGVSMILLIACSNLASLLLARAAVRRRELGVRLSLGASRARLVCQLLAESLLLSTLGGLLGILFSTWLSQWLLSFFPAQSLTFQTPDHSVLLYGLLLSLVTGFSFGLGPALAATKTNLAQALHAEGMASLNVDSLYTGWSRRNLLVILPLAGSLMLLIGSALSAGGAASVSNVTTSFDASHVIGLTFRLKDQGYDDSKAAQFRQDLRDRVSTLPGVASAALTDSSPLFGGSCQIQNPPPLPNAYPACHRVSSEFFETLGLRILRGRPFLPSDRAGAPPVAVVSQSFAEKYFPAEPASENILGQRIQSASGTFFDIVGVAADLTERGVGPMPVFPTVYIPSGQEKNTSPAQPAGLARTDILVRAKGDPAPVIAELRQAVRAADPSLWVSIQTIPEYFERMLGPARSTAFILSSLGALVLLMASVGIYALLAYSVSQRTREIGIRMALGARNREILALVMRRTIVLIAWGIALGLAGALALGKILASLVLKTKPPDTLTCIEVAALLAAVSLLASYLPARKALRVNPVEALRCE